MTGEEEREMREVWDRISDQASTMFDKMEVIRTSRRMPIRSVIDHDPPLFEPMVCWEFRVMYHDGRPRSPVMAGIFGRLSNQSDWVPVGHTWRVEEGNL